MIVTKYISNSFKKSLKGFVIRKCTTFIYILFKPELALWKDDKIFSYNN